MKENYKRFKGEGPCFTYYRIPNCSAYKPEWHYLNPPIGAVIYGLFEEDTYHETEPFVVKVRVEQHEDKHGLNGKLIKLKVMDDLYEEDYIVQDETLVMWRYVTL